MVEFQSQPTSPADRSSPCENADKRRRQSMELAASRHHDGRRRSTAAAALNGATTLNGHGGFKRKRTNSLPSKAARDPRDEPEPPAVPARKKADRHRRMKKHKHRIHRIQDLKDAVVDVDETPATITQADGAGSVGPHAAVQPLPRKSGHASESHSAATSISASSLSSASSTRSPTPVIDLDGLSRPSVGTRVRQLEVEGSEAALARQAKMAGAVRTILECVGEDPDREGLLATPERYAKAMLFFTQGYQEKLEDIVGGAVFHEGHNEMVIVKDIELFSLCEHHLVPFIGKMHIGYIPSSAVIGISKLPRIAEMFSRRLQIQERLTKEVANAIMATLKPQGVAVVMESSHLCMIMRGVQKTGATTITSCVLGCFEQRSKTRNEFLSLVGVNRR